MVVNVLVVPLQVYAAVISTEVFWVAVPVVAFTGSVPPVIVTNVLPDVHTMEDVMSTVVCTPPTGASALAVSVNELLLGGVDVLGTILKEAGSAFSTQTVAFVDC